MYTIARYPTSALKFPLVCHYRSAHILGGRDLSQKIIDGVKKGVDYMKSKVGFGPHLTIISTGNDAASKSYIGQKIKRGKEVGMTVEEIIVDIPNVKETSALEAAVTKIAKSNTSTGCIIQLPLFDKNQNVIHKGHHSAVDILRRERLLIKDVDGMHPCSEALYHFLDYRASLPFNLSCTPAAVLRLLSYHNVDIVGKRAVVIGRSSIVGLPMVNSLLMDKYRMTVTSPHRSDTNLKEYTKNADLIIVAAGKPSLITADMIKKDSILVDVGINRVPCSKNSSGYELVGDIDPDCYDKCGAYSPVPGGIGPITVAVLMQNTLKSALCQHNIELPKVLKDELINY